MDVNVSLSLFTLQADAVSLFSAAGSRWSVRAALTLQADGLVVFPVMGR